MHRLFFLVFGSRSQNTRKRRLFTIYMANRSVHGLSKWYAKFSSGKFRPGIAFTTALISYIYRKTAAKVWCWFQRCLWRNGTRVSFGNIRTEKTGALSIQPKRPVWISATSSSEWNSIFQDFQKEDNLAGYTQNFRKLFPGISRNFGWMVRNSTVSGISGTFPENFCSICRCYANFRKFWFNGKRPRSTCSDVLLLPDIFHRNDPKGRVSFTFKPDFPETFCKW